ncbi:hypothetical protein TNCV_3871881 [Trichonephila clavipes]|nr:hypothetical protein TNCV_3871881 [Trichonephila clavipes]
MARSHFSQPPEKPPAMLPSLPDDTKLPPCNSFSLIGTRESHTGICLVKLGGCGTVVWRCRFLRESGAPSNLSTPKQASAKTQSQCLGRKDQGKKEVIEAEKLNSQASTSAPDPIEKSSPKSQPNKTHSETNEHQ